MTDCQEGLRLDQTSSRAYLLSGIVKVMLKDNRSALGDFDSTIPLNPKLPLAYNSRGDAKCDLKDYRGAIQP